MDGQPSASVTATTSSGNRLSRDICSSERLEGSGGRKRNSSPRGSLVSSGFFCEISQFWQLRQRKTQPDVAREKLSVPGRKWNSGFFSTGSTWNVHGLRKSRCSI